MDIDMNIKIYNSLSKKKEVFKTIKTNTVGIYNCGPTVYDVPHIGNYRTFIMDDIIRRIFEYNNFEVVQVMNITDVDDKTIKKSIEQKITLKQLTTKYENLFLEELDDLHILRPNKILRATEYIKGMIDIVNTLLEKKIAYKTDDGVYMSIKEVPNYGSLVGLKIDTNNNQKISKDEYDKENPSDFALWKFKTPQDGDNYWPSPFGDGRPGWHIECSAMCMSVFGPTVDIHTGGIDLAFPHHTNEIAQSECVSGKNYVNYWVHGGFMTMNGDKMAKSKGNVLRLKDLLDASISPIAYRYWLLTAHYRTQINFTSEAVLGAQNALIKIMHFVKNTQRDGKVIDEYRNKFIDYINDDFDTPKAIALVWDMLKQNKYSDTDKLATLLDFDLVFGLGLKDIEYESMIAEEVPPEIQALIDAREEARRDRDWQKSDALREEIENRGYEIKDTADGPIVINLD